jgi:hypothetical protein
LIKYVLAEDFTLVTVNARDFRGGGLVRAREVAVRMACATDDAMRELGRTMCQSSRVGGVCGPRFVQPMMKVLVPCKHISCDCFQHGMRPVAGIELMEHI